jgi:apolipoprotein N-acyltransferase
MHELMSSLPLDYRQHHSIGLGFYMGLFMALFDISTRAYSKDQISDVGFIEKFALVMIGICWLGSIQEIGVLKLPLFFQIAYFTGPLWYFPICYFLGVLARKIKPPKVKVLAAASLDEKQGTAADQPEKG